MVSGVQSDRIVCRNVLGEREMSIDDGFVKRSRADLVARQNHSFSVEQRLELVDVAFCRLAMQFRYLLLKATTERQLKSHEIAR